MTVQTARTKHVGTDDKEHFNNDTKERDGCETL